MNINLAELANDPSFFLHEIDFQNRCARFFRVEPGLPNEFCGLANRQKPLIIPLQNLLDQDDVLAAPIPAPINFICMTDYCGSTLFAKALNEVPGLYLYNETNLFRDIAIARRAIDNNLMSMSNEQWRAILKIALFYQSKTFAEGDVALVKEWLLRTISCTRYLA